MVNRHHHHLHHHLGLSSTTNAPHLPNVMGYEARTGRPRGGPFTFRSDLAAHWFCITPFHVAAAAAAALQLHVVRHNTPVPRIGTTGAGTGYFLLFINGTSFLDLGLAVDWVQGGT